MMTREAMGMDETAGRPVVMDGDVIEFTMRGERMTAEAMLIVDQIVLLDLFDGQRPAWAWLSRLKDVRVYRPDAGSFTSAA